MVPEEGASQFTVSISKRLFDRLRGVKKREKPPPPPPEEDALLQPPAPPLPPHFWGGLYPGLPPPGPSAQEREKAEKRDRELAPIRALVEATKELRAELAREESAEAEQIKQMAKELHDKEYRAPSRPAPCGHEKEACVQCYGSNLQDPLRCADAVRAFTECSRRATEEFVKSMSQ